MASEFTNAVAQGVAVNANVLFTDTPVKPCCDVRHREGSGIFTLKGGHRYILAFTANVTGTVADEVSLAISIAGEPLAAGTMIVTPAAIGDFFNVATMVVIDVPPCCCYTVAVENTTTTAITVQNANLVIFKES